MPMQRVSNGGLLRPSLAALLLLAACLAASAADVGGGFWPATGRERCSIRGSGLPPLKLFGNLRFDFGGAAGDLSGTGTASCYDEEGQHILGSFPFSWTTRNGSSFKADFAGAGFADYVAARIEGATGKAASVTIEEAPAKGVLRLGGTALKVALRAVGEVSLDGGESKRFVLKMQLR